MPDDLFKKLPKFGKKVHNQIISELFSDCSDDDNDAIYEEITTLTRVTPPPILRRNDILSYWEDDISPTPSLTIVPRPKVGWTNRKVTFVGKSMFQPLIA